MRFLILLIVSLFTLNACDKPGGNRAVNIDLRIATFNVAMGLQKEKQLGQALSHTQDLRLRQLAEILQRVRPDVVLLNEFDQQSEDTHKSSEDTHPLSEDTHQLVHHLVGVSDHRHLVGVSDHRLVWLDISL